MRDLHISLLTLQTRSESSLESLQPLFGAAGGLQQQTLPQFLREKRSFSAAQLSLPAHEAYNEAGQHLKPSKEILEETYQSQ